MTKRRGKYYFLIIILIIVALFFQEIKSYTCMFVYSAIEKNESLLKDEDINLKIPSGLKTIKKDWYPLMLVFNADESFSKYINQNARLTILYSFGAFDHLAGASSFYNSSSDYYSSFYGAYIVKLDNRCYGFYPDQKINIDELKLIPKFDYEELVIKAFGCKIPATEFNVTSIKSDISYIGTNNWTLIEADIKANSPIHKVEDKKKSYIQYGSPPYSYFNGEEFPLINLKGRIYVKKIEEKNITLCLYIICPDISTINECDNNILSKSTFKK